MEYEIPSGSLGNLIVGSDGLIVAGCVETAEGRCGRHVLVTSSGDKTWHELEVDTPADIYFSELRRAGDRLFALGYGHYAPDGGAMIWTSIDSRSWSRIESTSFRGRAVSNVIESPSGALAVGYNAPIDSDNTSGFILWPVRDDGSFGPMRAVETRNQSAIVGDVLWTGKEFLAWTYDRWSEARTTLWASADAEVWVERAEIVGIKSADVAQIAVTEGRLVAVGSEGRQYPLTPRAWTSIDDGQTWVLADVPTPDAAMYTVDIDGSSMIARGTESWGSTQRAVSWSSTDGTAWARIPDDEDLPDVPGFSGLVKATFGDRACVAGTFFEETPTRGGIYCRASLTE